MISPPPEITDIQPLEEALHRSEVRRSRVALESLLAIEFVEFGASGTVYSREAVIDLLIHEDDNEINSIVATNYVMTIISNDAALLTYDSECIQDDGAKRYVLRSSIWKRNGDRWQMLFHQGTVKNRARKSC